MPWWLVWLVCNVAFVAGAWWASRDRKGCNYCLKTNPEYTGCSDIWYDNKLSVGYGNYIEINFCPMCGRYLRG